MEIKPHQHKPTIANNNQRGNSDFGNKTALTLTLALITNYQQPVSTMALASYRTPITPG